MLLPTAAGDILQPKTLVTLPGSGEPGSTR
jgi:hypothetical protein